MSPSPSLAATTREAVRDRPFLLDALRAGVLNYAAAARLLCEETAALDGTDEDTVTAALRRFREELGPYERPTGEARVSMRSGVGPTADPADAADLLLCVGGSSYVSGGSATAIVATGDVTPTVLGETIGRLRTSAIAVEAASVAGESLVVVVERRDGPDALRVVEDCV